MASLLTFVAGRLPERELLRRSLLRRVVGFGAPPELLTEELRAEVCANLIVMWCEHALVAPVVQCDREGRRER